MQQLSQDAYEAWRGGRALREWASARGLTDREYHEILTDIAIHAGTDLPPSEEEGLLRTCLWRSVITGDTRAVKTLAELIQRRLDGEAVPRNAEEVATISPREAMAMIPRQWLNEAEVPAQLLTAGGSPTIPSESYLRALLATVPRGWVDWSEVPEDWRVAGD